MEDSVKRFHLFEKCKANSPVTDPKLSAAFAKMKRQI